MTSARSTRSIFILAFAAIVATGCKSAKQPSQPATPVRVAKVARVNAPITVLASGVVVPMQTVAVSAQTSGVLLQVLFHEGDFVRLGQPLFQIDPRPLQDAVDQAGAILTRDEAQSEAARRDDVRYQTLVGEDYVTKEQADQIHAAAAAAAATVTADRDALKTAQVNLGYATIHAPIAGRTGALLVRRGNVVGLTTGPLVVIDQLQPILVRFPVIGQDRPLLQGAVVAHPLDVTVVKADSTYATENAQLTFVDNTADSLTGTVMGKATLANSAKQFWPGDLVFLTIHVGTQPNVLAVPSAAVLNGQQGSYVYVVSAANKATTRTVVVSRAVGDSTIISKGLAAGEMVVIDGQSRLNPGSQVAVLPGTAGDSAGVTLGGTGSAASSGQAGGDVGTKAPGTPAAGAGARTAGPPPSQPTGRGRTP